MPSRARALLLAGAAALAVQGAPVEHQLRGAAPWKAPPVSADDVSIMVQPQVSCPAWSRDQIKDWHDYCSLSTIGASKAWAQTSDCKIWDYARNVTGLTDARVSAVRACNSDDAKLNAGMRETCHVFDLNGAFCDVFNPRTMTYVFSCLNTPTPFSDVNSTLATDWKSYCRVPTAAGDNDGRGASHKAFAMTTSCKAWKVVTEHPEGIDAAGAKALTECSTEEECVLFDRDGLLCSVFHQPAL